MCPKRHFSEEDFQAQKAEATRRKAEYGKQRRANMPDKQAARRVKDVESHRRCRRNPTASEKATGIIAFTVATRRQTDDNMTVQHNYGAMSIECKFCKAKHFAAERPSDGLFTTCCNKGSDSS